MKIALWTLAVALLLPVSMVAMDGETTLNGEYKWNRMDDAAPLEAIFTPAGDDVWNVSFHFEFRGEKHVYTGQANGNLKAGSLSGEVQNEDKKRTWTFEGAFDEGTFKGTHQEHRGEETFDTGTLWLAG